MRIGVIGHGMVGGALSRWFFQHTNHDVLISDPEKGFDDDLREAEIVFVCVPAPTKSMKQDLSIIESVFKALEEKHKNTRSPIFVRSTVLPGTCDGLSLKYNRMVMAMPEFLTARRAYEDMCDLDVVCGYPLSYDSEVAPSVVSRLLFLSFQDKKQFKITQNRAAEMGKYVHNCFGAVKVTYFNAVKKLCEKNGIKYEQMLDVATLTGFIEREHTMVPGPDGKAGFGGTCLPKDLAAFIGFAGADASHMLFKDVLCLNRMYRGIKDYDDGTEGKETHESNVSGEAMQSVSESLERTKEQSHSD